ILALPCKDPDGTGRWIAVDLRNGSQQTLLAAAAGSGATFVVTSLRVTAGGRGVAITYSTTAPVSDRVNCGTPSCTLFFDRQPGPRQRRFRRTNAADESSRRSCGAPRHERRRRRGRGDCPCRPGRRPDPRGRLAAPLRRDRHFAPILRRERLRAR